MVEKFVIFLFALIVLLVGWGPLIFHVFAIRKSIKASGWAKTTGRVIESSVEQYWDNSDVESPALASVANVRYKYKVGGQEYESGRVGFGYVPDFWASGIQIRFAKGSKVEVFYDPINPEDSALLTGIKMFHIFSTFIVILPAAICTFVVSRFLL